ncbi:hypothetical protein [Burkholderia gladioli]|uniref:hypothetical protein n=1 Tax=Burkholderia gladioli TaxID=28095 RepID=UPI00163E6C92|nr:hypothetical protein [Burkholderia gladioli]
MTTIHPSVGNPIVDKLTYLLPWSTGYTKEEQYKKLLPIRDRIKSSMKHGRCKKAYISNQRYIEKIIITLPSGSTALVQIGAVNPLYQKGGINVTLNPSRLSRSDVQEFHDEMNYLIGPDYQELIKEPFLNRVDFAIDILNVNIDDLIVNYRQAGKRSFCMKRTKTNSKIEYYSFGSISSAYNYVVYDKRTEQIHQAIKALLEKQNKPDFSYENSVSRIIEKRNAPEKTRVEVRAIKLNGRRPHELATMANRFERFMFADLASDRGPKLSEFDRAAFLSMARQKGVPAAIALYEKERPGVPVREFWRSKRVDWWKPENAWTEACDALRRSGIFPECAFSEPPVHNLAWPRSAKSNKSGAAK